MNIRTFTPIAVTFETMDQLFRQGHGDAVQLYMSYVCISHWQKQYRPKATSQFMQKRLKWGKERLQSAKNVLVDLGLIQDIRETDEKGKVKAWYIQINHIVSETTPPSNPPCGLDHPVASEPPSTLNIHVSTLNEQKSTSVAPKKAQVVLEKPKPDLTPLSSAQVREYWDKILQEDKKNVGLRIVARFFLKKGDQFGFNDASRSQLQEIIRANIRAGAKCAVFDRAKIDNGITKVLSSAIGRESRVETLYKTLTK